MYARSYLMKAVDSHVSQGRVIVFCLALLVLIVSVAVAAPSIMQAVGSTVGAIFGIAVMFSLAFVDLFDH